MDEEQAELRLQENITNLTYRLFLAESKDELKSLLRRVKKGLKLYIQN